jgi:tetratricopeptide (TPR) repeat protein
MNHKPKLSIACIAGLLILLTYAVQAQEQELKKVIKAETDAFYSSNAEAWEAAWLHDAESTRTVVANGSYSTVKGWDNFGPQMVKSLKQSKATPIELRTDNYILRTDGSLAWVEYDQYINPPGADPKNRRFSREYRVLTRKDGNWKIATQITHDPETFTSSDGNVEASINQAGYNLLAAKKTKEAIEVFKTNVKLYPKSANVYDSLGEAYAADGDKQLAIKNYEKSIELNPASESGKAALAKLKQ